MNHTEKKIMDLYAKKVIDNGMSVPAVFFLEMFKGIELPSNTELYCMKLLFVPQ